MRKKQDVRKLAFNKETVRELTGTDMQRVAGGTVCMSISETICLSGPCAPKAV